MQKKITSLLMTNMYDNKSTSLSKNNKRFTIGHCSDLHAESLNWDANLREFIDFFHTSELKGNIDIDGLICSGDICNGFPCRDKSITLSEIRKVHSYFLDQDIPVYMTVGNHDSNIEESGSANVENLYTHALSKDEQFTAILHPYEQKWGYGNERKLYYKKYLTNIRLF